MLWHAAGARVKGESPPRRPSDTAWESYPDAVPLTRSVRPSLALCGKASVNSVALCRPLSYRHHIAPLERGQWNPRKGYGRLPRARSGWRRDAGSVECVSSVTSGPVRPSPPLCHHPRHCSVIPGTVEARDDETPPRPLLCILRPSVSRALELAFGRRPNKKLPRCYPRSRSWTGIGLATTPAGSKIHQDNHQLRDTMRHAAICSS
jgi:hypothetical protein